MAAVAGAQEQVTFESLLREMTDREALARWPRPEYHTGQFSSYDRRSMSPDDPAGWFANNDVNNFLRVEEHDGRREWVLADMEGPGAVVRIWSANPKGVLRIYLDGDPQPAIEAPMADLLGGKAKFGDFLLAEPLSGVRARGFNLYLPIPYAKHCKITSDSDGFYYQVNYRTYDDAGDVQTFNRQITQRIAAASPATADELRRPFAPPAQLTARHEVRSGDSYDLTIAEKEAGSVRLLALKIDAPDLEAALRSNILELTFDGIATVWCSVGDFFGSGAGINPHQDRFRRVLDSGEMSCAWVMPFRRSAQLRVWNLGREPVRIGIAHQLGPWQWDDRSMHFYARWRYEHPIHVYGARGTADWNYIEAQGQGVYVGDTLSVMNPVPEWWGEGDEKIYVDGETFPSHFGTGTEDYYGYAWCSNELFQHPFHSQTRCDGREHGNNWGHTTVSRLRSLDAIPFARSLKMDMELWHWRECDVGYSATTFFYARPGATHNRPPLPHEARRGLPQPPPLPPPFRIEGALECEALKVVSKSEGLPVVVQDMRGFGAGKWSGEKHLWIQGRRIGDFVELEIPAAGKGPQALTLYATRSWDYGILRFSINGQPSPAGDMDLYSGQRGLATPSGALNLGIFEPREGKLILRAEVVGRNPESHGSGAFFGLDAVVLSEPTQGSVAPGIR